MNAQCEQLRVDLGVYVLGALDAAERSRLEAHLGDCPGCRDELVRLAALPGLLRRLDPSDWDDAVAVPAAPAAPEGTDRLARRAVAELRSRRRAERAAPVRYWLSGVAAGVAVLLALGGVSLARAGLTGAETVQADDPASHVSASVRIRPEPSGTRLSLRLRGAGENQHCSLVAVAADGRRETAATWVASYSGEASVRGQVAIPKAQLAWLEVVTPDGARLVRLTV